MFSNFFIDRPIFATVLSIVIVILGGVAYSFLPIAQYPEVAPPVVQVSAIYPGANAKTVAETVATPIELEVNGVERMLYMSSRCTNDGQMYLDVTFEVGTNLDMAQVLVQNRVSIAEAKLPEEVKRQGVTTKKKSPAILLCVNLISPDASYDQLHLSNYALMNIKDDLARLKGVGDVAFLGPRDYSMRVWLDPNKLADRGMTVGEVIKAIREQNVQVAAGRIGQPPVPEGANVPFQLTINTQGRMESDDDFGKIIVKTGERGQNVYLKDVVRETKRAADGRELEKGVELGAKNYDVNSYLDGKPAVTLAVFQLPGSNALKTADAVKAKMRGTEREVSRGNRLRNLLRYDRLRERIDSRGVQDADRGFHPRVPRGAGLSPGLAGHDHPHDRRARVADRHLRPHGHAGVLAQQPFAVRAGAGDRNCRGRRDRGGGERGTLPGDGSSRREAARLAMAEVSGPVIAIALVLCAVFVPTAFMAGISGEFFRQFALTIAASTIISAFNSLTLSPACARSFSRGTARSTGPTAHGHAKKEALPRLGLVLIVGGSGVLRAHSHIAHLLGVAIARRARRSTPPTITQARRHFGAFGWFPSPRERRPGGSWPDW